MARSYDGAALAADAVGLKLHRFAPGDDLRACELVVFKNGREAVDTVLRRAQISGRVEINGEVGNHFADVHNENGDLVQTVALDSGSYKILKNRWMRCREVRP